MVVVFVLEVVVIVMAVALHGFDGCGGMVVHGGRGCCDC